MVGLDPNRSMLDMAQRHPKITYLQGSGDALGQAITEVVDIVTFAGSLFYTKTVGLRRELILVCPPGGRIVVYDFEFLLDEVMADLGADKPLTPLDGKAVKWEFVPCAFDRNNREALWDIFSMADRPAANKTFSKSVGRDDCSQGCSADTHSRNGYGFGRLGMGVCDSHGSASTTGARCAYPVCFERDAAHGPGDCLALASASCWAQVYLDHGFGRMVDLGNGDVRSRQFMVGHNANIADCSQSVGRGWGKTLAGVGCHLCTLRSRLRIDHCVGVATHRLREAAHR